jgi:hypothetical protein
MNPKLILCLALVLSGHCRAAITYPKAPDGGKQVVAKYLDPNLLTGLKITNYENLTVADPLAEYGAGDLITGKFLSTAELVSWRYLLMQGTNAVGAMELNADKKRGEYLKFNSLGKSQFDNSVLEAIRIAEQLPQVKKQDYELRYLWLHFFAPAIWLHGESNDIIIPLTDYWKTWNAYQPYSEGEIIKVLKPFVEQEKAAWAKVLKQQQKDNDTYAKAMMDYEKAHGRECGAISLYRMSPVGPFQNGEPPVGIWILEGKSSECGMLEYKARVTYKGHSGSVKTVEILEKLDDKKP